MAVKGPEDACLNEVEALYNQTVAVSIDDVLEAVGRGIGTAAETND